jgi:hypothetical protein
LHCVSCSICASSCPCTFEDTCTTLIATDPLDLSLSLSLSLFKCRQPVACCFPRCFFFFFSVPTFAPLRRPLPYWSPHHFGEHHKGHGNLRRTRRRIRRSRAPAAAATTAAVRQAPN